MFKICLKITKRQHKINYFFAKLLFKSIGILITLTEFNIYKKNFLITKIHILRKMFTSLHWNCDTKTHVLFKIKNLNYIFTKSRIYSNAKGVFSIWIIKYIFPITRLLVQVSFHNKKFLLAARKCLKCDWKGSSNQAE